MKKVLVIDDTKNIRMLLTTCLELKGYKVLTADAGKSAIDILKEEKQSIDIIFLDIRMPEMSGTEVLKIIRDMGFNCPVIVMTAFATVKNAVDCTKLGAVAYLQKPFSPDRVTSVLEEIFNSNENLDKSFVESPKDLEEEKILIAKSKKLLEEGEFEEAHNTLKIVLGINPYNKEIYHLISEVNKNLNKFDEAELFNNIYELF
ncbi:response regulator [Clostridium estertheticum]|uniref:Response regulator n=1 Tax=Clostridium estertheticum TaxID=238834 RepID=A0AA47I7N8_9CLOT|nr:response regulator [Clostridium estertheticum]MBU3156028.1 response regulator [Clostridium estertheticum]MBU3175545.1 response regulator [Clostridium estertheticum]MBU3201512.1 response regulator [Clostridium estertheticum]WAG60639.1 response regulator [Clostridium estertheticum]WAG65270.1 response regulator [Clostridium estertheticum]